MDASRSGSAHWMRGNSINRSMSHESSRATWGSVASDTAYPDEPSTGASYSYPQTISLDYTQTEIRQHQYSSADSTTLFQPVYPAREDHVHFQVNVIQDPATQFDVDIGQLDYPQWPLPASNEQEYDQLPRQQLTEDVVAQVDHRYQTEQQRRPVSPAVERYRRTSETHEQLALGRTPRNSRPEGQNQQMHRLRRSLRKVRIGTGDSSS